MRRSEEIMIRREGEIDFYPCAKVSKTRPKRLALYAEFEGERPFVLYKSSLPEIKLREVLEEEVAHHDLKCGIIYKEDTDSAKYEERRARSLALSRMVTAEAIAKALDGGATSDAEIADALDVSLEILKNGVEKMRRKYPRGAVSLGGKRYLTLEPLSIILEDERDRHWAYGFR